MNYDSITKCTNTAHKHIFTSFPNAINLPDRYSDILNHKVISNPPWMISPFPDSLLTDFVTENRVKSWYYLTELSPHSEQTPSTSRGVHRIRHCCFWACLSVSGLFQGCYRQAEAHSLAPQAVHHQCKVRENYFSAVALWACLMKSSTIGFLPVMGLFLSILQECSELQASASTYSSLHQAWFALHTSCMLAYKLCSSNIKSSFRSEQSHISKVIMSMVLLQTSLSSSTFLFNLLASKSLCPERLNLFPTPFQSQFVSAVFNCKALNTLVTVDQRQNCPEPTSSACRGRIFTGTAKTFLFQRASETPCSKSWEQKDGSN